MTREAMARTLERNMRMCKAVCDDLGIPYQNVTEVKVNSVAVRRLGRCKRVGTHEYEIEISERLLDSGVSQLVLMNTMLHELLHTCEGCMNHGSLWKSYARKLNGIGYDVQVYATKEENELTERESDYKYLVTCPNCGGEWKYIRRGAVIRSIQRDAHSCACSCGCNSLTVRTLA